MTDRQLNIRCDEAFFNKLKKDKQLRERRMGSPLNWYVYIKLIFGLSK